MIGRYQKRPLEIEAVRFTGDNHDEIAEFVMAEERRHDDDDISGELRGDNVHLIIHTLNGDMRVDPGEWVIRGVEGEFYPCRNDIFEQTYDPAGIPPLSKAHALLGKQVVVTLSRAGRLPAVVEMGQLLGFGESGEFEILEEDGFVHYCWPMLDVKERSLYQGMEEAAQGKLEDRGSFAPYSSDEPEMI